MRLSGSNDMVYRAYDLLDKTRSRIWDLNSQLQRIRYADIPCEKGGEYEALALIQHRFKTWGFGIVSHERIKELLDEFFIYHRIAYLNWSWPYRDPEESLKLMKEYEDAAQRHAGLYPPAH